MTGVSYFVEAGTEGTKLIHGVWINRWTETEHKSGEAPAPNLDVMRRWVEELRSGNWTQMTNALGESRWILKGHERVQKDEFCCLGVLCEIARRDEVVGRVGGTQDSGQFSYGPGEYNPDRDMTDPSQAWGYATLPPVVQRWAGVDDSTIIVSSVRQPGMGEVGAMDVCSDVWNQNRTYASELNDNLRLSFGQIADIIAYRFLNED